MTLRAWPVHQGTSWASWLDRQDDLEACDGCGMQLFDDFWVVRLRRSPGVYSERSYCTRCYMRIRDRLDQPDPEEEQP